MQEKHDIGWHICENHCGKQFKNKNYLDAHLKRVEK